ncbi:MAG: tRNA (N(6)-L-threonylcarbamoyladenosine(37)-C(2))-methylthiotransferase MtaB [Tissierellia bacterium]|nr:tRNA (N(6)-L-threonylcarbamoyladenosine(37)-C(2))-methylthiotransferase MtaB [Tissierellia bacterium]
MMQTFNIETLGCKVNQYESEAISEMFLKKGYKKSDDADVYIINTCTVTNMSDRKSRQMISKAKKNNPNAIIAVIGCYSQVKSEDVKNIEGVDIVLGSRNKEMVVELCDNMLKEKTHKTIDEVNDFTKNEEIEKLNISNQLDMTRAYMKIQDGCNMYCSYCLIPYARGPVSSRKLEDIVNEAKRLSENGYKEIILTGIHVASYGKDFKEDISLINVIEDIAKIDKIKRIRLSSMEPRHITREFLERMKNTKKACDHFHLSLQSGSDHVLKLMNRKYDTKLYKQKVQLIKDVFENAAITTDIICGFPNETDQDFKDTVKFVEDIGFSKVHIFKYSKRDGTKASMMENQVDGNVKKKRAKKLEEIEKITSKKFRESQIGKVLEVLIESKSDYEYTKSGYSTNYQRVNVDKNTVNDNEIVAVKIEKTIDDQLYGKVVERIS